MTAQNVELFTEILASERMSAFGNYSHLNLAWYDATNPAATWEQLKMNPWVAMAVFWDMEEKNAAIYSGLDERKNNVLSKTRNIIAASEKRQDKRIAEFVDECLESYFTNFESFLYESLDSIGKGVSIGEIIFAEASDRIYIQDVKFKPQHLFSFGETGIAGFSTASMLYPQTGPLQLRAGVTMEGLAAGQELPEQKFFVFSYRPKHGNRWGDPVDRKAFWWDWILRSGLKNWLKYQEKGSGVVVAKYPSSAGVKEQEDALGAASAVHDETAVAIPDKFEMEIHEMVRNLGSSHKELIDDYCTAQITRIYLGQTLTSRGSDGGGSRALGEVHERVSQRKGEADCKALIPVVNERIIKPLVHLNFGPNAACPKWFIEYDPPTDVESKAKIYAAARNEIGIEISREQVRDDLQLEQPKNDEDALLPPVLPSPSDPLDDPTIDDPEKAEFAEKKTLNSGKPSNSKTVLFRRFRPSMIKFSDER